MAINFLIDPKNLLLAAQIQERAQKMHPDDFPKPQLLMTLGACHNHGCRIDFAKLLAFDDFNFDHDIYGISRHLSHNTGKLLNCFLPRCAMPKPYAWAITVEFASNSGKAPQNFVFVGTAATAIRKGLLKPNAHRIDKLIPMTKTEYLNR